MSMVLEMWATPLKEIPEKGRFQTPYAKDGLYYPEPHAKNLWTGKKIMIVKKRPYPQFEDVGTHILGEYSYGILTLGPPEQLAADLVRVDHRKEHLISDEEWSKWDFPKGDAKVWVYRPSIKRNFRHPYDYYFPKGAQTVIKDVRLIEPIEQLTHPSGKGEEIKPVEESYLEAPNEFIEEYLETCGIRTRAEEWFVLEQKRAYPETSIEELAKRDFSLWVIQQHLIGEYGKRGERGLKRDNLLDLPIKEGKAHWDFRFQRINLETGKALDSLEFFDQEFEEAREGWTQTKPPLNEPSYEKKILVVSKAIQPKAWLFMKGTVEIGEAGAGTNLRGHFHILEREFGIKGDDEPNFKEYFLFGRKWNGRFVVRRVKVPMIRYEDEKQIRLEKPVYRWTFWKTKDQTRFAKLLRALDEGGRKIPNKALLVREYPLEEELEEVTESFEWSMPQTAFKELKEGILIEGEAIGEGMTKNLDIFSYDELLEGARTLINQPLELDHVPNKGVVLDANFNRVSRLVEYQALISDLETQRLYREGKLYPNVSVRACWRRRPWVNGYKLVGIYFTGLSLLKDVPPAAERTSMKVVRDLFRASKKMSLQERYFVCESHGRISKRRASFDSLSRPRCQICGNLLRTRMIT